MAGAFICGFTFIIVGYILNFLKSKNKLKVLGFIIFILFSWSNVNGRKIKWIQSFNSFSIFILAIDYVKLKNKILVSIVFFSIFLYN